MSVSRVLKGFPIANQFPMLYFFVQTGRERTSIFTKEYANEKDAQSMCAFWNVEYGPHLNFKPIPKRCVQKLFPGRLWGANDMAYWPL